MGVRTIKQNTGREFRQEVILFPMKLDTRLREFIHSKYPNDTHGKIKLVVTHAVDEYITREEKKSKPAVS
jgi:hypothetical protein